MVRNIMRLALIALAVPVSLIAATKAYDVAPFGNCIGITDTVPPNNNVSQTYVNVLDSLTMVSVWVGDVGNGERYHVEVSDLDENVVATGDSSPGDRSWSWLNILLDPDEFNKPVRGKTYKVIFTREGGAAISFGSSGDIIRDY